jgi:KDO2-lipid IV(A) lauroyltransferase
MAVKSYSYRHYMLSAERRYQLEPDALTWKDRHREGRIAYRDVEQLSVFKVRFLGSSATYWSCVLSTRSAKIRLSAAMRESFRSVEDRTTTYIPFIKELEARVAKANPNRRMIVGRNWLSILEAFIGQLVVFGLRAVRCVDLKRTAPIAGWLMRKIGPLLRGHRIGRSQLTMAYPNKSSVEIEQILSGMWDNLGRVSVEFAHLDRLWSHDPENPARGRIVIDPAIVARWRNQSADPKSVLFFAAHLANWEIPAMAGLALADRKTALVYRAPNSAPLADEFARARMARVTAVIPADHHTSLRIRKALKRGWMVGMLVDQHYAHGIDVTFFDRRCKVNPLLARFARLFDCNIYGTRVIRLPNGQFRLEVSEAIDAPRDAEGKIDVVMTMQMITSIIEGWVREHPEQWLWLHRRWR